MKIGKILNDNGLTFTIRLVERGDSYGRGNERKHPFNASLVEFYDPRYNDDLAPDGTILGRYVWRCYTHKLMELTSYSLCAPITDYRIGERGMAALKKLLTQWGAK